MKLQWPPPLTLGLFLVCAACKSDITVTETARCDGRLQGNEGDRVDSPFDQDGDGYFDANNLDCQEAYAPESLDCDDGNFDINPGMAETGCNGIDDDCSVDTPDEGDGDGDGFSACIDCDDTDPEVHPGANEIACNERDDDCDESTADAYDDDEDGWDECSDCDDWDPEVHPDAEEIPCNEIDDDCSEATPDAEDLDGDGVSACDDCDDQDESVSPDLEEICDDGVDNNCNDDIDEECDTDYTGTWVMDASANYSCAFGLVSISVGQLSVYDAHPVISVGTSGSQPGTMSGAFTTSTIFQADNVLSGGCTETYEIIGEFVATDVLHATLSATFTGGASCFDCSDQSWTFTAYR
jgi:hypothetical protein